MADLKTNYKDDVLDTSVNEKRKFNMIQNSDGTVSFEDVTEYTQTGDSFGAADINATNAAVNKANSNLGQRGNYNFLTNWVACPKGQTTLINLSADISSYPFLLLMLSNAGSDTAINSHETVLIPTKMFISGEIKPVLNWYTNSGGIINFMVNVMYNNNNSVNAYTSVSEGGTAYVKVCGVK